MSFYAHSLENQLPDNWETMAQHEQRVATRCAQFLKRIHPDLESWGDLLGRWHDLGKYSSEFQNYIRLANKSATESNSDTHQAEVTGKVDHSTAAAQHAVLRFMDKGKLLAYALAGHHAGLPDWNDGQSQSGLRQRLDKRIPDWATNAPRGLADLSCPTMPDFQKFAKTKLESNEHQRAAFRVAFWIRFIFSGLVDADFLATEAFVSPERSAERPATNISLTVLAEHLRSHLATIENMAEDTTVNLIRRKVGAKCVESADLAPGFFSLCVPTGGGKHLRLWRSPCVMRSNMN